MKIGLKHCVHIIIGTEIIVCQSNVKHFSRAANVIKLIVLSSPKIDVMATLKPVSTQFEIRIPQKPQMMDCATGVAGPGFPPKEPV